VELAIPKLRLGDSSLPSSNHASAHRAGPLRRVMEASVHGVSTRAVDDDLVEAMGSKVGISKSGVGRICVGSTRLWEPSGALV
jgi:transposase-like protein